MTKPPPLSLALGDAHRMGSWGDTGATKTQATLSPGPETRVRSLAYSHFGADGLLPPSPLSLLTLHLNMIITTGGTH